VFDRLRNHPNRAVILGAIGFGLWSLPQWFGSVWPLFTTKTIPEWMSERSWPGVTPAVYGWVTVVLGIAIFGVVLAVALATRNAPVPKTPPRSLGTDPGAKPSQYAWASIRISETDPMPIFEAGHNVVAMTWVSNDTISVAWTVALGTDDDLYPVQITQVSPSSCRVSVSELRAQAVRIRFKGPCRNVRFRIDAQASRTD
jgi:hypothetical protein